VSTLDAAFCGWRIGAHSIDIEFIECASELRMALAGSCGLLVDPEHARFVAVECQRLAIVIEILVGCLEIRERRLNPDKQHHHQTTRRIVYVDQRCARWSSILKPAMIASIDLDQLAEARAAAPGLLNLRRTKSSRNPQTAGDHEGSDGLDRQIHAVALSELLGRQCRPKIGVR
jgi:hypothetical protein